MVEGQEVRQPAQGENRRLAGVVGPPRGALGVPEEVVSSSLNPLLAGTAFVESETVRTKGSNNAGCAWS